MTTPLNPATPSPSLGVCDPMATAAALPFAALVTAIEAAAQEYQDGGIISPERLVVPMGPGGVMLSMPATSHDIGIHKLVTVQPGNAALQRPTIHGIVTVCAAETGQPLCLLDGPELTGRRTAAVSLVAIRRLLGHAPKQVLIVGTGVQSRHHVKALQALYPDCAVWVRGTSSARAQAFCAEFAATGRVLVCPTEIPAAVDAVITLTTATQPVYDEPARVGRVIVGVGAFKPEMAEIGKTTLDGSVLYADDPAGARHEAGDLMRAGVQWEAVRSLATLLREEPDRSRAFVFKSVGTGAWDLAAARVALQSQGIA
ncbi:bifunctional Delta(1)-pyrroline-2-carboxylate/Delta(1)-piperideine-2-carboxylate reductase [Acidovorax sp. FJL06]|uniref:bifunctional Delta(1)-pyrroline-2-carboxylate/Delta(1)-piperideine-2- carboxylate reductase n=1 Tax=Acidovorax sp. FJL06 TaxID=2153365 RepID=UPI000F573A23|nr:bifunctional Delta(1)-pyrroline-2-carboxylate/Delta(1)-piperideine-2-carboxylate reductase [Acidovorax sp. FJL06]RQO83357.1 delta(1)-pyrroline-2-carboxylate reductase family protein [Acidovorax sp. FJL06]